jgi:hypothetical protein
VIDELAIYNVALRAGHRIDLQRRCVWPLPHEVIRR